MSSYDGEDRRKTNSGLEQHFSTIMTALILASILWIGSTSLELVKAQTSIAGDIKLINVQVENLKELVNNTGMNLYTRKDASYDSKLISNRISVLSDRITRLEKQ